MVSWLQITSGRGPEECCWVAHKLSQWVINEAKVKGIKTRIIDMITGDKPKTFINKPHNAAPKMKRVSSIFR